jgi:hypothetical protein
LSVAVAVALAVAVAQAVYSWQMTMRSRRGQQSQLPLVLAVSEVRETVLLQRARALIHLSVASSLSVVVAVEQAALPVQKDTVHPAEDHDTTAQALVAVQVLQELEHLVREAAVGTPHIQVMAQAAAAAALAVLALTQHNFIKAPEVDSV